MKTSSERLKLTPTLTFTTPDGGELSAQDVRFEVTHLGDQLHRVVLEFKISPADWSRVDAGHWFHLTPDVRGTVFGGALLEDVDVEIEVVLAEASLPLLAIADDNIYELGGHILVGSSELRSTESWLGMYVKQPRGPIKAGFSTTHSDLRAAS
jgi:hypothetical protein